MIFGIYIKNRALKDNDRLKSMRKALEEGGCSLYEIESGDDIVPGTDAILSVGETGPSFPLPREWPIPECRFSA